MKSMLTATDIRLLRWKSGWYSGYNPVSWMFWDNPRRYDTTPNNYLPLTLYLARGGSEGYKMDRYTGTFTFDNPVHIDDLIEYFDAHPRYFQFELTKLGGSTKGKFCTELTSPVNIAEILKLHPKVCYFIDTAKDFQTVQRYSEYINVQTLSTLFRIFISPFICFYPYNIAATAPAIAKRKYYLYFNIGIDNVTEVFRNILLMGALFPSLLYTYISYLYPDIVNITTIDKNGNKYIDIDKLRRIDVEHIYIARDRFGIHHDNNTYPKEFLYTIASKLAVCYNNSVEIIQRITDLMFNGTSLFNYLKTVNINNGVMVKSAVTESDLPEHTLTTYAHNLLLNNYNILFPTALQNTLVDKVLLSLFRDDNLTATVDTSKARKRIEDEYINKSNGSGILSDYFYSMSNYKLTTKDLLTIALTYNAGYAGSSLFSSMLELIRQYDQPIDNLRARSFDEIRRTRKEGKDIFINNIDLSENQYAMLYLYYMSLFWDYNLFHGTLGYLYTRYNETPRERTILVNVHDFKDATSAAKSTQWALPAQPPI